LPEYKKVNSFYSSRSLLNNILFKIPSSGGDLGEAKLNFMSTTTPTTTSLKGGEWLIKESNA
jgi:hypothetical protein